MSSSVSFTHIKFSLKFLSQPHHFHCVLSCKAAYVCMCFSNVSLCVGVIENENFSYFNSHKFTWKAKFTHTQSYNNNDDCIWAAQHLAEWERKKMFYSWRHHKIRWWWFQALWMIWNDKKNWDEKWREMKSFSFIQQR